MKSVLLTAVLVLTCSQVRNLFAQPALDRVEQRVRRQLDSPKAKPPRVAAPPAALQPKPAPPALAATEAAPREPGYLGLVGDVQEGVPGVRVLEVVENAAAATAGMQTGDLITSINGRAVADMDDMAAAIGRLSAGSKLEFEIQRSGAAQQLAVVLGTRPAAPDRRPEVAQPVGDLPEPDEGPAPDQAPAVAPAAPPSGPRLGVRTISINADIQQRFNLADTSGAFVNAVTVGSPADKAGITVGSIIVSADGRPVATPDDLAALIRRTASGRAIELVLLSRGREVRRRVVLAGEIAAPGAAAEPALAAPTKQPFSTRRPAIAPPRSTAAPAIRRETDVDPPAEPAPPDAAPTVEVLQRRIEQLEARIAQLEAALAEKPAEP